MASEINREEFLGISFSHHMEILHKQRIFMRYFSISIRQSSTSGTNMIYVIVLKETFMQRMVLLQIKKGLSPFLIFVGTTIVIASTGSFEPSI